MKRIGLIFIVLALLGAGALLLSNQAGKPTKQITTPPTPTVVQTTPTTNTQSAMKEFTVTGQNFSFSPNQLTVKKGDTVKITFKNVEGFHDFMLDAFNVVSQKISTGQEDIVTFVADKTGTFEYYCSIGNHRAMGMKGTLTVQ